MKRNVEVELSNWIAKENNKPLIIYGARQVGKTYIIHNFFQDKFNLHEYDLIKREDIVNMFETSQNVVETFKQLSLIDNINLESNKTIVFFDEVQVSEKIIQSLKYLNIEFPNINFICSGSLLGVALKKMNASYPVGYVEEYIMYPMNFKEFLVATGNEKFIEMIENSYKNDEPLGTPIHNFLIGIFHQYLALGGMPELIKNYLVNGKDLSKTDFNIIKNIDSEYQKDMSKYISNDSDKIRIHRIYDVIVPQLEKSNPKFTYAKIDKKDNRKRDYTTALDWLISSYIVHKCNQVTNPIYPLMAYEDDNKYKLFLNDVGILSYKTEINKGNIILDGDYPFKGVLTENYVACELINLGYRLLYFSKKNENNNGNEIDFLLQLDNNVIPIEVKSSINTQSKSLSSFIEEFKPPYSIRISAKNFGFENGIKSVPLYAVFCIR